MTYSLYGASFVYTFERVNVDVFGAVVRMTQSSHTQIGKIQDLLNSLSASLFFISKDQTRSGSSWMLYCWQQVTSVYP